MDAILPLLRATRSASRDDRHLAEKQLSIIAQNDPKTFSELLLDCAKSEDNDIGDKQSALYVLKTFIQQNWTSNSEHFVGPQLPDELREFIRQSLLQLLTIATNSLVRSACALAILCIGDYDYPAAWPSLASDSITLLNSDLGSTALSGGLVLFIELVRQVFSENDFLKFGVQIMTRIYDIAAAPINSEISLEQRNLAIKAFRESTTFFLMSGAISDDVQNKLEEMAEQIIPHFVLLFIKYVEDFGQSDTVNEVTSTFKEIDSAFQELLGSLLPKLYPVVVNTMLPNMDSFDDTTMENYCYMLELCLQSSSVLESQLSNSGSELAVTELAQLLIKMSDVSESKGIEWLDDYNEFVTAEMELDIEDSSARSYAGVMVAGTGNPFIMQCLIAILKEQPLLTEPILYLVSNFVMQVDTKSYSGQIPTDLYQVLLQSLEFKDTDEVLVVARKCITASFIAKYCVFLGLDIRRTLAKHSFSAPYSENFLVKAAQLKSMSICAGQFSEIYTPDIQKRFYYIIEELLIAANEDTPLFLTECLRCILSLIKASNSENLEASLTNNDVLNLLFQLVMKNTADNDLTSEIIDVVGDFLDVFNSNESTTLILKRVADTIVAAESSNFAYSSDLCFALELAGAVFSHDDIDLSGFNQEEMLDRFYEIIVHTEDPQVFQVATFTHLALYKDIKGSISKESSAKVVQIAQLLLKPSLNESLAVACGEYFVNVIDVLGENLWDTLLPMIGEASQRLVTAKNALLVEALIMLFCELTLRNPEAIVQILSEYSMLEPVMKQWLPTFEVIRGEEELEKNIKALETLVDLNNPQLNSIMVNDEVIRNGARIITRSKAKDLKFSQVPLPVKIIKMFVNELSQTPQLSGEGDTTSLRKAIGADSDDEWVDELALNDEGEVVNYKTFKLIINWFESLYKSGRVEWLSQLTAQERRVLLEASKLAK